MSRNDNLPVMVEEHSPPCRQFLVEYDLVVFQDCLRRCQCLYRVLAPHRFFSQQKKKSGWIGGFCFKIQIRYRKYVG